MSSHGCPQDVDPTSPDQRWPQPANLPIANEMHYDTMTLNDNTINESKPQLKQAELSHNETINTNSNSQVTPSNRRDERTWSPLQHTILVHTREDTDLSGGGF